MGNIKSIFDDKPAEIKHHHQKILTESNIDHRLELSVRNIFWLDQKANNTENSYYQKKLRTDFKDIKIITFNSIETLIKKLLEIKFESVFILVSGYFFKDFPFELKEIENELYCYPIVILFTSDNVKNIIKYKKRDSQIQFDEFIYNIINHPFYNAGGIFTYFDELYNYFASFKYYKILNINESQSFTNDLDYSKAITFQKIETERDLILPLLYKELESNDKITSKEINNFHKFISNNHYYSKINTLFYPLMEINKNKDSIISLNILSKFWAKLYTFEYPFYKTLNNYLMNNDIDKLKDYYIFIKMMYKGLELNSLRSYGNKTIYRGCILNIEEIQKLEKNKNYNKNNYPKELLYSRSFLSFSKKQNIAENYIIENVNKKLNKNLVPVLLIIESLNNKEDIKYLSNCYMKKISEFSFEKEVLFFPYSSFIVEDIIDGKIIDTEKNNVIPIKKIKLSYLGKYKQTILNGIKNIKNIKEFINEEKKTNKFVKEYINNKIDIENIQNNKKFNMENIIENNVKKNIEKNIEKQIIKNIEKVIIENNPKNETSIINSPQKEKGKLDKNKCYFLKCKFCSKIHFEEKSYYSKYYKDIDQWKIIKWDYKNHESLKIVENWNSQIFYDEGCICQCKQSLGKKWFAFVEV